MVVYSAYELTWWTDAGCYSEVFDHLAEALSKRNRVENMGATKGEIKGLEDEKDIVAALRAPLVGRKLS